MDADGSNPHALIESQDYVDYSDFPRRIIKTSLSIEAHVLAEINSCFA